LRGCAIVIFAALVVILPNLSFADDNNFMTTNSGKEAFSNSEIISAKKLQDMMEENQDGRFIKVTRITDIDHELPEEWDNIIIVRSSNGAIRDASVFLLNKCDQQIEPADQVKAQFLFIPAEFWAGAAVASIVTVYLSEPAEAAPVVYQNITFNGPVYLEKDGIALIGSIANSNSSTNLSYKGATIPITNNSINQIKPALDNCNLSEDNATSSLKNQVFSPQI